MAGLNKVILIGNLGKDPEVRHLDSGAMVANFSLATSETYNDKNGQRVEQTEWHNIVLWRKQAEIAEKYLSKGKQIYLEGRIKTRSWEDKDGNNRYTTEIFGDRFIILGRKGDEPSVPNTPVTSDKVAADSLETPVEGNEEDDLPF